MNERYQRVLEYPKILNRLAGLAVSAMGKERALALRPSGDFDEAGRLISKVAAETLNAVRVGIWKLEQDELRNLVIYDRRDNSFYIADPFGLDIYPKYVSKTGYSANEQKQHQSTPSSRPQIITMCLASSASLSSLPDSGQRGRVSIDVRLLISAPW